MIFNFTKATSLVSKLNCSILGWFYTEQNTSRRDVASDRQYQEKQAGGMFGLLVSGDASNKH
jgi:hypothetical protein